MFSSVRNRPALFLKSIMLVSSSDLLPQRYVFRFLEYWWNCHQNCHSFLVLPANLSATNYKECLGNSGTDFTESLPKLKVYLLLAKVGTSPLNFCSESIVVGTGMSKLSHNLWNGAFLSKLSSHIFLPKLWIQRFLFKCYLYIIWNESIQKFNADPHQLQLYAYSTLIMFDYINILLMNIFERH